MMSRENASRRNRALRKIRRAKHVDAEIKAAIEVILDLLNAKSGYEVAWPSAATIAGRYNRSRRTGLWYVKAIKALSIFRCVSLPPQAAADYCEEHFGIRPRLERCGPSAPNLFIVDSSHPLWDTSTKLPQEVDHRMGQIIRQVKDLRNARSTSRLASDPAKRPRRTIDPVDVG